MAPTVAKAVIDTDNAVLPPARWVMKFEILPPGQAATRINPNATEARGVVASTSRKVSAGSSRNCEARPTISGFGAFASSLKSRAVRSMAIENMTMARIALSRVSDPAEKFRTASSIMRGCLSACGSSLARP